MDIVKLMYIECTTNIYYISPQIDNFLHYGYSKLNYDKHNECCVQTAATVGDCVSLRCIL